MLQLNYLGSSMVGSNQSYTRKGNRSNLARYTGRLLFNMYIRTHRKKGASPAGGQGRGKYTWRAGQGQAHLHIHTHVLSQSFYLCAVSRTRTTALTARTRGHYNLQRAQLLFILSILPIIPK